MATAFEPEELNKHRRHVLTNDGVQLSVIDIGHGPPLVILPAWTNAAIEYWRQIVEFARDHRVVAMDMRGWSSPGLVDSLSGSRLWPARRSPFKRDGGFAAEGGMPSA